MIIITGLAAQHLVTHQPVQLETMSGGRAGAGYTRAPPPLRRLGRRGLQVPSPTRPPLRRAGREAASLAEHVAGIAQAQQEGAGHDQPAGGQGAAGATAGAHWQAWRDRRLAAAQTAAAGKRKSPEPGLAEEEEEAPAAKATRTGGGRGGRGKAAAP